MSTTPQYVQGADIPDLLITWLDQDGDAWDFSSGWTFSLKLGRPGSAASLTKTTGITGAAVAPNVTVAFGTTGELNTLTAGPYTAQLTATRIADSKQLIKQFPFSVAPSIT